jgi:uncharacterized repeat protein (TIGR01451 family)
LIGSVFAINLAILLPAAVSVAQPASFGPAANFAVGPTPFSVAVGDFNGDGRPDLVAGSVTSDTVSILLGTGTGAFGAVASAVAGLYPRAVAIGDLNGDGRPDLAVANSTSNTVSILLGTGTGTFGAATAFAAGTGPYSVAVGDLNGDGRSDLAVANGATNSVSVLLGSGTGAFGAATAFAVGTTPYSVAIGDLNGDGRPDLAVANSISNTVSILLGTGTGTGTFGAATAFAVGTGPYSVAIGDLNGDGLPDLVVANANSNSVSILLGTGTGAFGAATNFAVGTYPQSVVIGDLNGDGRPDLAVANRDSNDVSILLGTGAGAFGAATAVAVGTYPVSVAIGDLNGDAKPDLAVANEGSNTVSILLNTTAFPPSPLGNISSRARVLTGNNVLIGGFIIQGTTPKTVLLRARGPSMGGAPFNIAGTLANPTMQLYAGATVIAQNDDWQSTDPLCGSPATACGDATQISATAMDPCQPNPGQSVAPPNCAQESALLVTLPPGGYTAIVSGVSGGTGVGLVEVFAADTVTTAQLINISSRARVETGNNVLIGGLIIQGTAPKSVLLRARGPSMGGAPFNIAGTLANPTIQLYAGATVIAQNDNWQTTDPLCLSPATACGTATQISATAMDPCQPNPGQSVAPPGCSQESALFVTLPPGGYTTIVSGVGGGMGVGLVEVFDATPPTMAMNNVVVAEGNAGTSAATFTVTLSRTSASPVTVNYATADGTATTPSDYVSTSGTLTIPPGSTTGTINVAVNGDTLYEADETFTVTLSAPTNATVAVGQDVGTGTITNDDSAPTLAINNVSLPEGNAGTTNFAFTVTQSAISGLTTTVNYATADGTATAPSDYVATSGTLTIPTGNTTGTINVAVNGDTVYEPNETFTVILSGPMMATATTAIGTGTILNDDSAADLGVTKTDAPDPATAGSQLTYTVIATNHGPDGATGVMVTDTLPVGVTFGTATWTGASTGTCSQSAGTVTCSIGNLANAASVTISIVVTPTAEGTLTNTVTVSGIQTDLVPGNNSASATTTVNAPSGVTRLVNLSSRARVLTGDNVLIGGFIISGTTSKTVLLRARGPSMGGAPFNIPGVLANPTMELYSGATVIAQNNNWQTTDPLCLSPATACGNATQISATAMDPCQPNPGQSVAPPNCGQESALLVTLPPGSYSAIVRGVSGGTGVGLVEVFEADTVSTAQLTNISSRGRVETGDNVLVGGIIIAGTSSKTVLLRARGPSLAGAPFNLTGVLANPTIQLYSGAAVIAQNDNWQTTDPLCGSPATACGNATQITATGMDPCQPNPGQTVAPPNCSEEAAILVTLPPGAYTAIVSGVSSGVGVGLVEVFEVP